MLKSLDHAFDAAVDRAEDSGVHVEEQVLPQDAVHEGCWRWNRSFGSKKAQPLEFEGTDSHHPCDAFAEAVHTDRAMKSVSKLLLNNRRGHGGHQFLSPGGEYIQLAHRCP
jgi:hypothetical protein